MVFIYDDDESKRLYITVSLLFKFYNINLILFDKKRQDYSKINLFNKKDIKIINFLEDLLASKLKGYTSLKDIKELYNKSDITDYHGIKQLTYYEAIFGDYPYL